MSQSLAERYGHPVRVTVLDPGSRERVARFSGVLADMSAATIVVACLQTPSGLPDAAPATVEILQDGQLHVAYTRLCPDAFPGRQHLVLERPTVIQTEQRRKYPRVDLDIPVHVIAPGSAQGIMASIRDLSAGGASLQCPSPLSDRDRVALLFQLGSGLYFQNLEAEVVRVATVGSGNHIIGLRFFCDANQEAALKEWVRRRLEGA